MTVQLVINLILQLGITGYGILDIIYLKASDISKLISRSGFSFEGTLSKFICVPSCIILPLLILPYVKISFYLKF